MISALPTKSDIDSQIQALRHGQSNEFVASVDWRSTALYWLDPREQRRDANGRTPFDRRECVHFPK